MQRLSEAAYPETGKETYHYDGEGLRFALIENGSNTNSLHTLLQQNNICPDAISKYVSDNTNHAGYHKLYSDEVQKQIDGIAKEMSDKRNPLIRSGMDTMMADTMIKAKSQEKVRN